MSYYILFNPKNRDPHIAVNAHGFPDAYNEYEEAEEEAEACKDDEHYRSYIILRDKHEV